METTVQKPGQGARVLLMGSILQLFLGIIYVWSIFVLPVSEFFKWDVNSTKLTSSFMLCCFVLGILISGRLQLKIATQKIVLAGGLAMALGMLLTSLIPVSAPWLIYVTYGVIGGFGVGMAYNAIISCAQKWFPKKRGLATGVSVCMFGFSTVVFAPLVEWLVGTFGLVSTFRILAAAFALATVALFSFVKLPAAAGAQATAAADSGKKQYTTGEMLKTKQFYFIALSMMLFTAAYFIMNPSFKTLSIERGLDPAIGTVIVMMTGIANALGRLATPWLSDKIGCERATFTIIAITVLSCIVLSFATGALFMVAVALIAFCYGGSSGVYPVVTSTFFGLKNVGSNYGAVMVGFALSALFFPMLIGLIPSTVTKFFVLAILATLSAILILLLMQSKKKMQQAADAQS